jgi:hypothetical protein
MACEDFNKAKFGDCDEMVDHLLFQLNVAK